MTIAIHSSKMLSTVLSWALSTFVLVIPPITAQAASGSLNNMPPPTTDAPSTSLFSSYERSILNHINQHRKNKGLSLLSFDPYIQHLARRHSRGMALNDSLTHGGFQRRASLIQNKLGAFVVAENIACKQKSAQEVATAWISSPGHRQNLEGKYDLTGISAVQDRNGEWYYTQIFAAKKPAPPRPH